MRIKILCRVTAIVLSCALYASPATAKTWHVPGDAATIQGGINLASANDTVLVACGVYYEHDIRMKSGVCLRSETGSASCVTIDAQQQDRVIYCRFVASTARIEGFTITGGYAKRAIPVEEGNGGGLYCLDNSSPTVENCIITGDSADWDGGGVYCGVNSSATFINCTITGNSASNGGSGMRIVDNSDATMTDCTVSDNFGTGIWIGAASSPTITNCTFSGNSKRGIYCSSNSGPTTLTDCNFSSNTALRGAGMNLWKSTATLINCTFFNNAASSYGGGLYLIDASVALINCSLRENSAREGGGIYLKDSSQGASYLTADTTEFFDNTANEGAHGFVGSGSEAVLTCSVSDLSGFASEGIIILNYDGCFSPTKPITWGRLKAMFAD
ncbi:MAG: right-handed parallel beta-helix repeat-containing protein [Candidatus Latescibacterota bacterium]|nr:MAG: right-handed parallel beta-helix repeat-containing protein [Candidatus Latescibacterota bacterium]